MVPSTGERELVLALADDELCVGQNHAWWIAIGPFLEEDLAFTSIAQDELGHARSLYSLLTDDVDELAYGRRDNEYRSAHIAELCVTTGLGPSDMSYMTLPNRFVVRPGVPPGKSSSHLAERPWRGTVPSATRILITKPAVSRRVGSATFNSGDFRTSPDGSSISSAPMTSSLRTESRRCRYRSRTTMD